MKNFYFKAVLISSVIFGITNLTRAALPFGVFPFLTTGWYYKPSPVESIVLGLIVVKVLAIRLGATLAGVPYHLNDIFDSKALPWNRRGKRYSFSENMNQTVPLSSKEIDALERILLALRRIDSHDCFIRYICQVNQNHLTGKTTSPSDQTWLSVFRLRPTKQRFPISGEKSVWDIYEDALSSANTTDCTKKYSLCPLSEADLSAQTILAGIF